MSKFVGGWLPQNDDPRDYPFTAIKPVSALASQIDLRWQMSPIYNQGDIGSCTGNGTAAVIAKSYKDKGHTFEASRLFIYYNGRAAIDTVNEDSGATIRDCIKSVNKLGVCKESTWGYDTSKFTEKPSGDAFEEALKHQSLKYEAVLPVEQHIKSALSQGFPIVFGFMVQSSFMSEKVAKTGVYSPKKGEKILGGHCVVLVGYNDDQKTYLVRNSWGEQWGKGGYFTMPYSLVHSNKSSDFWVIKAME